MPLVVYYVKRNGIGNEATRQEEGNSKRKMLLKTDNNLINTNDDSFEAYPEEVAAFGKSRKEIIPLKGSVWKNFILTPCVPKGSVYQPLVHGTFRNTRKHNRNTVKPVFYGHSDGRP